MAVKNNTPMFFELPAAQANFKYVSRMNMWDIDLATALTLSKNPELVNHAKLQTLVEEHPFAREYMERYRLAQRAIDQELNFSVKPGHYLAWAKRVGIDYPAELEKRVLAAGGVIGDWKTLNTKLQEENKDLRQKLELATLKSDENEGPELKLSIKTRNTMLRIINELTRALINDRTNQPNKDAVVVISALKAKDITPSFTPQTLANYLKEASKL